MTEKHLLAALSPHFSIVAGIIRAATEEFESFNIPPERRPVVDGAPSGIMIWYLIWNRLEQHFGRKGPVRVVESDGLKCLYFEDPGVTVRVNKLDAITFDGPVSRNPGRLQAHTQLCFSFYDRPPGHLVFGYTTRLNGLGAAVLDRILLTLEGEDGVQWLTYIDEGGQDAASEKRNDGPTPPVVRPKVLPESGERANG